LRWTDAPSFWREPACGGRNSSLVAATTRDRVRIEGDDAERVHVANEWADAIEGFFAHVPIERWMNHPIRNVLASHKLEQLTRAAAFGLTVPKTLVTQSAEDVNEFWRVTDGRVIAKPLASGYLERPNGTVASIYTSRVQRSDIDGAPLAACPTLFQQEIAKDYDVRITVIDDRLTAVSLRRIVDGEQVTDIRRDNMENVEYAICDLPAGVEAALWQLVRSYELRFAAVDFAVSKAEEWTFFEINPNGQWAWMDLAGVTALWRDFAYAFSS
jgi:glutathione synthase/RimK-type ligase-like ATP-grasp enzyme